MGDQYASTISNLVKGGTIASNQARFILQNSGYLPTEDHLHIRGEHLNYLNLC